MVDQGVLLGIHIMGSLQGLCVADRVMRSPFSAIAVFAGAVTATELLDWDRGVFKALCMAALLGALVWLTRGLAHPRQASQTISARRLAIAVGILLALQLAFAVRQVWQPQLIDIPASTLEASRALLAGENPYTTPVDHTVSESADADAFRGFKYSPLMAIVYVPLGIPLGDRGVVLSNLVLQLATAWLVYRLARVQGTRATGLAAALAYLALPIGPWEVLHQGVPDLAPVLPLLVALLLIERNAALAGFCVGISLSVKLLPAGLLLPCLLPSAGRARASYAVGIAAGAIPILLAALWSPAALWNNLVLFNLTRPPDSTSWLYWAPSVMSPVARGALLVVYLSVAAAVWRARHLTIARRCGLGSIVILTTLLTGPIAHNNYQLWWLPLASILLGVTLGPRTPDMAQLRAQCTTR